MALIPPALPPQSVAPLSKPPVAAALRADPSALLFNKTWWLFFQNLLSYVTSSVAAAPTPTGASVQVFDFTLTANLTIDAAATSDPTILPAGSLLAVFVRQDGTGGWITTWSSPPFRGGGPAGLGVLPSTWSVVFFVDQVDPADGVLKWWTTSIVTNQT